MDLKFVPDKDNALIRRWCLTMDDSVLFLIVDFVYLLCK